MEIGLQGGLHVGVVQFEANEKRLAVFVVNEFAIRLRLEHMVEQSILGKDFTDEEKLFTKDWWTIVNADSEK